MLNRSKRPSYLFLSLVTGLPILLLIGYALWASRGERKYPDRCAANLRYLGYGLIAYATEHGNVLPPHFGALFDKYVPDLDSFTCPSTDTPTAKDIPPSDFHLDPPLYANLPRDKVDYFYLSGWTLGDPPQTVVAFDVPGNHGAKRVHVLFLSTDVSWITTGELRSMLARQIEEAQHQHRRISFLRGSASEDPSW